MDVIAFALGLSRRRSRRDPAPRRPLQLVRRWRRPDRVIPGSGDAPVRHTARRVRLGRAEREARLFVAEGMQQRRSAGNQGLRRRVAGGRRDRRRDRRRDSDARNDLPGRATNATPTTSKTSRMRCSNRSAIVEFHPPNGEKSRFAHLQGILAHPCKDRRRTALKQAVLQSATPESVFRSPQRLRCRCAGAIGGTPGSPTPAGAASLVRYGHASRPAPRSCGRHGSR